MVNIRQTSERGGGVAVVVERQGEGRRGEEEQ